MAHSFIFPENRRVAWRSFVLKLNEKAKRTEKMVSRTRRHMRYVYLEHSLRLFPYNVGLLNSMSLALAKVVNENRALEFIESYARSHFRHADHDISEALFRLANTGAEMLWKRGNHQGAFSLAGCVLDHPEAGHELLSRILHWQLMTASMDNQPSYIDARLVKRVLSSGELFFGDGFSSVHLIAEALIQLGRVDEAIALLDHHKTDHMAYLSLSNACVSDETQWLRYVNRFFSLLGLDPISLLAGDSERFCRLDAKAESGYCGGPKISVIMTAFNVEKYIATAIRSMLAQTWQNFELLVVDDISTDNTRRIVRDFMAVDDRIKLIENSSNCGTYVSRNKAYDIASGEFVTCHDSDDWAHPYRLESQIDALLKNPEAVSSSSKWVRMHENGIFSFSHPGTYARFNYSSLMFEINRVKPVMGYWDSVRISADSEFIKRLHKTFGSEKSIILDDILMIGLKRRGSLTTNTTTGHKANGISPLRKQYHKSFDQWHKRIDTKSAYLDFPLRQRLFSAPEEIVARCDAAE